MAVVLAYGVVGCGAQPTPAPTAALSAPRPTPAPNTAAISSLDPAGMEIVLWHPWLGEEEEALLQLADEFNTSNEWGITVRVANQGSLPVIERKVWTALSAGRPPDLIVAGQDAVARLAAVDAVQALDEYVTNPKYGLAPAERDQLNPAFIAGDRYPAFDGQLLSWPLARSLQVLYYNADWLEGLGYDGPPQTWVDFEAMCRGATGTRKKTATFGYAVTAESSTFAGWLYGAGGSLLAEDGRTVAFNQSPGVEAMAALQNVLRDGVAYIVTERDGQRRDFVGQKALFVLDSTASLPAYARAITDTKSGQFRFNWSVAPLPFDGRRSPDQAHSSLGQETSVITGSRPAPPPSFDGRESPDRAHSSLGQETPVITGSWPAPPPPHDTSDPVLALSGPSLAVLKTTSERQLAAWLFLRWWTEPSPAGRWAAAINAFPLHRAAMETEAFQSRLEAIPPLKVASTFLGYGRASPAVAGWSEVRGILDWAMLSIADGQDVRATLDAAAQEAATALTTASP